jgi:hypothetical protein
MAHFGKRGPNRSRFSIPNMVWGGRWRCMEKYPFLTEVVRYFLQEDGGHQQVTDARRKAGDVLAVASNDKRPDRDMARAIVLCALANRHGYRRDPWFNPRGVEGYERRGRR